ncbi:MAG: tRNA preQ1(34) S-adenosylmethionine ribosyltransferase-isomerase QueA [Clostridia bacterium]|nr:tRNA preQ1(34) S-adenosylmethionine ribosyltransferase-isomerase QueA [Clostridia bacterium]MBR2391579.1 tRNA preQ1(34) S-adenosylmethionine ribosyltransferase-isomerase QueA [Clostridia bacterium]
MKTSDFYYDLPEELIAQTPASPRDSARMIVYNKAQDKVEHKIFRDIIDYLTPNDVLVVNNTRVIPARLFAHKVTGANIEVFLLKRLNLTDYEVLMRPAKKAPVGTKLIFSENLYCEVIENQEEIGGRIIRFNVQEGTLEEELDRIGEVPLPPYIHEKLEDDEEYQTIYSKISGSSAAPTAGLHFTDELMQKIRDKGVQIEEVTLQVGLGTFRPVNEENALDHKMHSEEIVVSEEVAERLNNAKKQGKRIVAVGTTTVRTLEAASTDDGVLHPCQKETNIFIYPGVKLKFVDALITNFHLPESTLIMLVSAFIGREKTLEIYNTAVKEKYRFFSFGDCCFFC